MVLRLNNNSNDKNNNALNITPAIDIPPLATRNTNTTWPVSPIIYNNNNHHLRDCDSPAVVSHI